MLWTGKGKVVVAAHNTPVPLATAQVKVNTVMFTYDQADAPATIYIKDRAGNIMASMAASSTSATPTPIIFSAAASDQIDLRDFQLDSSADGKGPFVALGTS